MTEGIPKIDEQERRCMLCGKAKPLTDFHRHHRGRNGRRSRCAQCTKETRKPTPNRKTQTPEENRRYRLSLYGITPEQYDMMLAAQGGGCAICHQVQRGKRKMAVDHCHETGRVRAILCYGCNRWLGIYQKFRNGVAEYDAFLEKYGDGNPLLGYEAS